VAVDVQPVTKLERGLLVGGRWESRTASFDVINPADGSVVGGCAVSTPDDVDEAVRRARGSSWARMHPDERCAILRRTAQAIRDHVEDIARVLTLEQGKPVPDSRKEILFGADVLDYYAEEGRRVHGSLRPNTGPGTTSAITYYPVGVVGAIVPWNYPVDLYAWKVAPALAAGCTVVVKPPQESPLAIGMVARLLVDAGLPEGTLSDLPGGADIGVALTEHPDIAMVTATCSTATGKAIMASAARTLKKVSLELGGHCPLVVLPDADLELAAAAAARRSFSNMGQICIAVNRVIVHESVADEFVAMLTAAVADMKVGNPSVEGVLYGPCTTPAVVATSEAHIEDAVARGARLTVGGRRPEGPDFANGYYFEPTVLDEVPAEAVIMHEETFGPVLAVHRVPTVEAAVEAANAASYGLAAYVYDENLSRALAVADRIEAGGVGVNVNDVSELQAPFGGWKQSGIGRELGPEGLQAYLEAKHVKIRLAQLLE
jgi:acyl-CoA reductase-like NAD-dependent aldehyde dehydrogenase